MILSKWFQGINNLETVIHLKKKVFIDELKNKEEIIDKYDDFSLNVVVYDDSLPIGTGRLIFNEGKHLIDKICVLKEFRGNNYGELIIRMLVRKSFDIGSDITYSYVEKNYINQFKKVGFLEICSEGEISLMVKIGDIQGDCCNNKD